MRQQLNRSFEHEERLRVLCMTQQEINKLLDLDKSDTQAGVNDNMPQDDKDAGTFVERLAARRTDRGQVNDLEGVT